MVALIIAVILGLTGGTSAIAEKAIPGDVLYGVKTSINEPVAGLFAVSKEANATWQERLVERRLEEAQKVATQGTLSTSTQAEIKINVSNQIDKFNEAVKILSADKEKALNSSELAVRLESALHAHQDILEKANNEGVIATSTREIAKELISAFKESESKVKGYREEMELTLGNDTGDGNASSTPEASVLNKQDVAEKILNNLKTKYEEGKADLSTTTKSSIDQSLSEVEKTLMEGKSDIGEGKTDLAREKFQEVIKSANKTRVDILTGSIKANIEGNVDAGQTEENQKDKETINSNSASTTRKDISEEVNNIRKDNKKENSESPKKGEIEGENQ